jgi:hypothetical protein
MDSIYTDLGMRWSNKWTETLVKEKAANIATSLLTSFTLEKPGPAPEAK